jgi:tetratricopeptide (TPR) repeat protein
MTDVQEISTNKNFLEVSVVKELIQNIDVIENKCRGQVGEDIVNMRIKHLAYAKLLCNVYNKDIIYLIKAHTQLGIGYLDIGYFEQAQEHLLQAFKLNDNINEDLNILSKEYQIKILINLAKCYLENNKPTAALSICEKCLKTNKTLMGDNHVSNADIYYVLAKVKIILLLD